VIEVVAAVIARGDEVLVTRRPPGSHLEGLWEFPGGKVHKGESPEGALRREIREELDAAITIGPLILDTSHEYEDRAVRLRFYTCRLTSRPHPTLGQEIRWVAREALDDLEFPAADAELIRRLVAPR